MNKITKIELHLEDWTAHYPTGVMAYNMNGELVDSDYADTVNEFKEFVDRHKQDLNNPDVIAIIDMEDVDVSDVLDIAAKIRDYIQSVARSAECP